MKNEGEGLCKDFMKKVLEENVMDYYDPSCLPQSVLTVLPIISLQHRKDWETGNDNKL